MKKRRSWLLPLAGVIVALVTFFNASPNVVARYLTIATIIIILIGIATLIVSLMQGSGTVDNGESYVKDEFESTARKKLEGIAGSFHKLASSFEDMAAPKTVLSGEDMQLVLEDISTNLCKNCKKCGVCWERNFNQSYQATWNLLETAKGKGNVTVDDLPDMLRLQCIQVPEFVEEANRNLSMARMKMIWHNRIVESREAVAGQLGEISRIVKDFSGNLCDTGEVIELKRRKINQKLRVHRIKVQRVLMFERENRGMELHLRARCRSGRCLTTKEAAVLIGNALDKRFVPREDSRNVIGRDYDDFVFCEDANFKVLTGVSRASKNKGELNGDNFSFLYPDSQDVVMMLSDGMGSGSEAYEESEMVIELLEQFLEAGFHEEPAIKLINSVLVLRSEHSMFSTVDLCIVNLCAGTCEFVKIGAATTFIKRDHFVETISSTSMPAGILNQVDYDSKSKKLYDGDYVIMVSDGVIDCVEQEDKEGYFKELIKNIPFKSPQEIANAILSAALEQHGYVPADDMTVLVTGIWKK